jgi:hypothetical protein
MLVNQRVDGCIESPCSPFAHRILFLLLIFLITELAMKKLPTTNRLQRIVQAAATSYREKNTSENVAQRNTPNSGI